MSQSRAVPCARSYNAIPSYFIRFLGFWCNDTASSVVSATGSSLTEYLAQKNVGFPHHAILYFNHSLSLPFICTLSKFDSSLHSESVLET